jgi:hypothetical protein
MKLWKDQPGPLHSGNKIKAEIISGLKRKADIWLPKPKHGL